MFKHKAKLTVLKKYNVVLDSRGELADEDFSVQCIENKFVDESPGTEPVFYPCFWRCTMLVSSKQC